MSGKIRADVALVRQGTAESREKAQAAIMAGQVYYQGRRILKSAEMVSEDADLEIRISGTGYVSRGALKLEKAAESFKADLQEKVVADIGASTGGFTEVCLRRGAQHVYSVDVGYGQLDWKLRNDSRVTVMERTNARYLTAAMFPEKPSVAVMDVSFISIKLIIPAVAAIIGDEGVFYTLIKPQFEAGREKVGKKGVVRSAETHEEVIRGICEFAESIGWRVCGIDFSPITGPEGNIEFLAEIRKKINNDDPKVNDEDIVRTVRLAHESLNPSARQ